MSKNKFNIGDLVYYVALDENMRWTVYGSTITAAFYVLGEWKYVVKHQPVNLVRPTQCLHRDIGWALEKAKELNKKESTSESKRI